MSVGPCWAEALKRCQCDKALPAEKRCTEYGVACCAPAWNEYARRMLAYAKRRAQARRLA